MKLLPCVMLAVLGVAGCKASFDPNDKLAYHCAADAGLVTREVATSAGDPQCPSGMRCGLDDHCHVIGEATDYLCLDDSYCEGSWRCGPEGKCVSTDADSLEKRSAPPVTATLAVDSLGPPPGALFGASNARIYSLGCTGADGGAVYAIGKSASWVDGQNITRVVWLSNTGSDTCDLPRGPATATSTLPSSAIAQDVIDLGNRLLIRATVNGKPQICTGDWDVKSSGFSMSCSAAVVNPDSLRGSFEQLAEIEANGQHASAGVVGLSVIFAADAGAVAIRGEIPFAPPGAFSPLPVAPEPLSEVVVRQNVQQNNYLHSVVASGKSGALYTAFATPLGMQLAADGGTWPALDFGRCFQNGGQGFPPAPTAMRMARPNNGLGDLFFVATPGCSNNSNDSNETCVQVIQNTYDSNSPNGCSIQDPLTTQGSRAPTLPDGGWLPGGLGPNYFVLLNGYFRVCRDGTLLDFAGNATPGSNGQLTPELRAFCSYPDGGIEFVYDPQPNSNGGDGISTRGGQVILPHMPLLDRPLRFWRSNQQTLSFTDDRGHFWLSDENQHGNNVLPNPQFVSYIPDRAPTAIVLGGGPVGVPMLLARDVELTTGVPLLDGHGWIGTRPGLWDQAQFSSGEGLIPAASVVGEPAWTVMELDQNAEQLPSHVFVADLFSNLGKGPPRGQGDGEPVRVAARLDDPSLIGPPYFVTVAQRSDGGTELLVAVRDALATADVTNFVNDPTVGYVNSAAEVVNIPPAEVRVSPASRASITSIAVNDPTGSEYLSGYLVAGGRLFDLRASSDLAWESNPVSMPGGAALAVANQGGRMRVIYRDGRVFGLPSRVQLASGVDNDPFREVKPACNELIGLTSTGLYFLDASDPAKGQWHRIDTAAVIKPGGTAALHQVGHKLMLVDDDVHLFQINAGDCQ